MLRSEKLKFPLQHIYLKPPSCAAKTSNLVSLFMTRKPMVICQLYDVVRWIIEINTTQHLREMVDI